MYSAQLLQLKFFILNVIKLWFCNFFRFFLSETLYIIHVCIYICSRLYFWPKTIKKFNIICLSTAWAKYQLESDFNITFKAKICLYVHEWFRYMEPRGIVRSGLIILSAYHKMYIHTCSKFIFQNFLKFEGRVWNISSHYTQDFTVTKSTTFWDYYSCNK